MNDQLAIVIDKFATKLGVTAEHLFSVMMAQAKISAMSDIAICCLFWALFAVLVAKFNKCNKDDYDATAFWGASSVVVFVICITITALAINSVSSALLNPEYWALHKLLGK